MSSRSAIVIGGGPAGLMAAERLLAGGVAVDLYEAMPSLGRKFLMAGKGGLNITHAEPSADFVARYGGTAPVVGAWLAEFGADDLRAWIHGLGVETFVGTSGRVFPAEMKAAPLLRGWLHRLRGAGLNIHARHRWLGWAPDGSLRFATPTSEITARADATILALGGGSWPQLGSDGAWQDWLTARGIEVRPLVPANCGFDAALSSAFRAKHAGAPLKNIAASFGGRRRMGEAVIADYGVEGGLIYAFSAPLRKAIARDGGAVLELDLLPQQSAAQLAALLAKPRGTRSLSSHVKSSLRLDGTKAALIRECTDAATMADPLRLAAALKALPLRLTSARPLAEAISSAGGVALDALDRHLMLHDLPSTFCAGEMLDWEAPTGGYLLTACFASGLVAGDGALAWLRRA
jgi:uncharacterized flavoprotein (TIGR03862 family)